MPAERPSVRFLVIWHLLVAGVLCAIADLRVAGPAFWHGRGEELLATLCLIGAYGAVALVSIVAAARGRPMRLSSVVATSLSVFALAFFVLLLKAPHPPYSRALLISLTLVGLALFLGVLLTGRWQRLALGVLVLGFLAVAGLDAYRSFGPQKPTPMVRTTKSIPTELYTVQVESYENPVPKSVVRGGAIASIGDQYLLATGDGRLYVFGWPAGGKFVRPRLLPYRIPYNPAEFILASHTHWRPDDANADRADNVKGVQVWQFRVADVLVSEQGEHVQVFASHHYWNDRDKCFTVRVSMLEADRKVILAGGPAGDWQTVFEATPCLPIEGAESLRTNNPFGGMEIGGRMQMIGPDQLLLTVGDHDFSGLDTPRALAQEPDAMYGKTILIHLQEKRSEVFTTGHRNPQGLFQDSTGVIWETEHGPQGGDELNILNKGSGYGWPKVTYGTDYGSAAWPLNTRQGRHDGFVTPVFAWVPSIGVSNLVRVQGDAFPNWKDDLLVTSLHAKTVFRVRIEGRTAVFAEPIEIGERIRDIIEGPDGQILLWTDLYNLISLQPAHTSGGAALFGTRCGSCHRIDKGTNNTYGPDLYQIVGNKAGSNDSFDGYSPAMKAFGKTWTKERLDAFIASPQTVVPGTLMGFPGIKDEKERAAIVTFLDESD